ncbi:MAG: hypothetical protein B1H08_06305 [Candidatus Omnitrophica bacterium 4484_171]|nr:MAG: hypothetical protein B1H08_06305 [Candidatus Omnitrophica bacterium 4484_171]
MRVLFITRNFPPQIGGLEKVAYYLYSYLKKEADVILLKWSGSKKLLFLILPYFLMKASFILIRNKVDIVYLNEGFISVVGIILKFFRIPVVITINGLDITYNNVLYQLIIPKCIMRLDRVICISRAAKEECLKRGIAKNKIIVISPGFENSFYAEKDKEGLKNRFKEKSRLDIQHKKVLVSVGRLIERKGVHWFIDKVIPLLLEEYKDFIYVVVGDGPTRGKIESIIQERKLSGWIKLLGRIDDGFLKIVYNIADIFIMPNIPVKGDLEGFGIVALEAVSCKVPVIASDLEGIKDALLDGAAGSPISPLDAEGFKNEILKLLNDDGLRQEWGEKARKTVEDNFRWGRITKRYLEVFEELRNR